MRIGILGLGSMGQPMARRLAQAGFSVIGFNRTRNRAEALLDDGVGVADTPDAVCDVDLLITMVSDDEAIEQLFWQNGRFLTMGHPGLVHAGMSTISDTLATRLAATHRQYGQSYISAPVFGPPEAAQSGKLYIAAAGDDAVIERCLPALKVLGRVEVIGSDPATANVVKAAGNFLMACVVEGLRDALTVVQAAGGDPRQFTGLITQALFPTPVYQYLGGALAKQLVTGGPTIANPFIRSAQMSAASADRLGVAAPLAQQIARHEPPPAAAPTTPT
jgi:3-hydroxyisobutyrate dehydrogenase-like beta-hydroxyacid dehydrogenase